jgi:putative mRNA 3-end processing factor
VSYTQAKYLILIALNLAMELSFLGACKEVGRAAVLLEEKQERILLDYGVRMNDETVLPLPVKGFLDGIIVSHAHLDHSGAVPMLYKNSEIPCYMTPPSLPLIDLLVQDSIKVAHLKGLEHIFSKNQLKRLIRNIILIQYNKQHRICAGVDFTFQDAGHILGSATVNLRTKNHSVLFTGDIKYSETRLHSPAYDGYKDVDVMITESTYGDREHPDRKELEKKFVNNCEEVCDSNGNVLVPSFAVGRAQELLSVLEGHKFDYPVYIDGMSKKVAEIMLQFPNYIRDSKETFSMLKKVIWVENAKTRENALKEPSVIISTAGFLQGGPAVHYLFKMKELPNQAVFFVGYQPQDEPGHKLLETKRFQFDDYDLDYKELSIKYFDFSAHSGRKELLGYIRKTDPKLVFCIHGDDEQIMPFSKAIKEELGITAIVPKLGEKFNVEKYL